MNPKSLLANLSQFIGTEKYYRITNKHLLTDGTKYLAEEAQCFWLMTAIASHLSPHIDDYFVCATLKVKENSAVLTLDNGNGFIFATQDIEYTDFPLEEIKIFCCFDGMYWILMLPSEY